MLLGLTMAQFQLMIGCFQPMNGNRNNEFDIPLTKNEYFWCCV